MSVFLEDTQCVAGRTERREGERGKGREDKQWGRGGGKETWREESEEGLTGLAGWLWRDERREAWAYELKR